jgi:hypothetical protein
MQGGDGYRACTIGRSRRFKNTQTPFFCCVCVCVCVRTNLSEDTSNNNNNNNNAKEQAKACVRFLWSFVFWFFFPCKKDTGCLWDKDIGPPHISFARLSKTSLLVLLFFCFCFDFSSLSPPPMHVANGGGGGNGRRRRRPPPQMDRWPWRPPAVPSSSSSSSSSSDKEFGQPRFVDAQGRQYRRATRSELRRDSRPKSLTTRTPGRRHRPPLLAPAPSASSGLTVMFARIPRRGLSSVSGRPLRRLNWPRPRSSLTLFDPIEQRLGTGTVHAVWYESPRSAVARVEVRGWHLSDRPLRDPRPYLEWGTPISIAVTTTPRKSNTRERERERETVVGWQ